jgi:nucleolar protein 56
VPRVQLVTAWYGAFLLDGGRVAAQRLFPREPAAIASRLMDLEHGAVLPEERELASEALSLMVTEPRLLVLPGAGLAARGPGPPTGAAEHAFPPELFRAAMLEFAKRRAREAMGGRDQHVVQAVQAIDDLAETANQLAERLREWYGLHFPEADRLVERHEEMATLISQHATRDAILAKSPHLRFEGDSMGAPLGAAEQAALRGFAKALSTLYAQRAELDKYLEEAMPGIAPNVTRLVGPAIAARMLFHARGLRELATLPSGTIQTLGAEKALFRHLKEGKRPPKHGVLFQHPLVHRAPFRQRGAIARTLAGKVAIAARADAYTGHDVATQLLLDIEQRVEALRAAPPRRKGKQGIARQPPGPRHAQPGRGAPRGPQGGHGFAPRRSDRRGGGR